MDNFKYSKILIIMYSPVEYEEMMFKYVGIEYAYACIKKDMLFYRYITRMLLCLGLEKILYDYNLKNVKWDKYDVIIVHDGIYQRKLMKYVRDKNKHCRLFYWTLNTMGCLKNRLFYNIMDEWDKTLKDRREFSYKIVSFDKNECKKYNLLYNKQAIVRFKNLKASIVKEYDVYFRGRDKNRIKILKELSVIFSRLNIEYKFEIVPDKGYKYSEDERKMISNEGHISYIEMLNREMKCKAVLDIVQEGQHGLTWRPLESLFYHLKLITNFKEIVEYDFYHPNNIFILGQDNLDSIQDFLNSPYHEIDGGIVKRYTFDEWIKFLMK